MALELVAPAKLNLTLEVLSRRPDGYHEIASVMQTIDVSDRIRLEGTNSIEVDVSGERGGDVPRDLSQNLAYCAAVALREAAGRFDFGARISLEKCIPAGLGFGGGSSDAAAVLRGLNRLWRLSLDDEVLARIAAGIGSDVPFFLVGGTAVVSGYGDQVQSLPDIEPFSLTLFIPDLHLEEKTRRMYGTLTASDFTQGGRTKALMEKTCRGESIGEDRLVNAFDGHVEELAPSVALAMAACRDAGLHVITAGSGPGFFTLMPTNEISPDLVASLSRDWGILSIATGSLNRMDAMAVREI